MQTPPPVSSDPLREAFRKEYPKLEAELSLGENNPDFRGLDDINARHAFARFSSGWSARATLTTIPSATEPAHLAVKLAAFREAIRGHIGGEEYALISEVVRAIASRATEPDRNAAFDERAEFEASMRSCSTVSLQRDPEESDEYYRSGAMMAWVAWQIRAGLEEPGSRGLAAIRSPLATRTTTKD